ncbi:MAG TPA: fatty acid desaturase [Methylophilaceae bacterium]|nr:fatty acid desaturase [Methylophilaceae bacterium]
MSTRAASLRDLMAPFTRRSTPIALSLFIGDILLLGLWTWAAVYSDPVPLKILFSLLAGDRISALFVIGHDAAHGAYTGSRRLNQIIGRIAFLPSLHNYSLWQVAHNRKHHRFPNLKGLNSWSPLSPSEYRALSPARKLLQRFYRSPLGFGPYYVLNRWLPDKFYPTHRVAGKVTAAFWYDFALLAGFIILWLSALATLGSALPNTTPWKAILWGGVIPFAAWNYIMGLAIYLQHTNVRVPWFESEAEWQRCVEGQHDVTCHVAFPDWYNFATHNIMQHVAHHIHPKIPLYRLHQAEKKLAEVLGQRFVADRFTLSWLLRTMRDCKLYDYEGHRWLDFDGNARSAPHLPGRPMRYDAQLLGQARG